MYTQTLKEEIKFVGTSEQELKDRDESKLKALLECSKSQRSDAMIEIIVDSIELSSSLKIITFWMSPARKRSSHNFMRRDWKRSKLKYKAFFAKFGKSEIWRKGKKIFYNKLSPTFMKFPIETLKKKSGH